MLVHTNLQQLQVYFYLYLRMHFAAKWLILLDLSHLFHNNN